MKKVTFAKAIGALFLIGSLFMVSVSFVIGPNMSTIAGLLFGAISIMYLVNPALTYNEEQIELKNLLGMAVKTHYFGKDEIAVRDGKVYVNGNKLRISSGMLVRKEYDTFITHVQSKVSQDDFTVVSSKKKESDDLLDSEL